MVATYLKKTAIFVRDLLDIDEQLIRIGRINFELEDMSSPYIGIDALGGSRHLAKSEKYDGEAEEMTYVSRYSAPVTISFYNDNAADRAEEFSLLIRSQKAYELQEQLGISVYQNSTITDVKMLMGSQYNERVELDINVHYNIKTIVSTLRIDTAQGELITENKEDIIWRT
jgi:hypothetical protein